MIKIVKKNCAPRHNDNWYCAALLFPSTMQILEEWSLSIHVCSSNWFPISCQLPRHRPLHPLKDYLLAADPYTYALLTSSQFHATPSSTSPSQDYDTVQLILPKLTFYCLNLSTCCSSINDCLQLLHQRRPQLQHYHHPTKHVKALLGDDSVGSEVGV